MLEEARDPGAPYAQVEPNGGTQALRRDAGLASDRLQNAILTSVQLAVMATNASGLITFFNFGAERLLGYCAVEVVNRISAMEIHDPQELVVRARAVSLELSSVVAADFEALSGKAERGLEDFYESTLIRKDRTLVPAAISITSVRDDFSRIIGYLWILTDISARKQLQLERDEALSLVRQADPCQSDLLARMSHEMRTPLSAILGFAQLMASGSPCPTLSQQRNLDLILHAGWHLENLIQMTHDLARLDSGALSLSLESVPLSAVMLQCQAMTQSQARIRDVEVTLPLLDAQCSVLADAIRLQQALGSLLSAAIENSPPKASVIVECDTRDPDWIRLGIHDSSGTLSAGQQARHGIWQLLAKRLVEAMGGYVGADSPAGTGSLFSIYLKRMLMPRAASSASTRNAITR